MGLEAINYFFHSKEEISQELLSKKDIVHRQGQKYVYKKDNSFWIDLEFQDQYSLSLRITLCNPQESVLEAFHHLLSFLFNLKDGTLVDMNTKKVYKTYDNEIKNELEESYLSRKKIFENMYGNYTAAIGSEEFYKRMNSLNQNKNL